MNSIKKIFIFVVLATIVGFGFNSCSNEDEIVNNNKPSIQVKVIGDSIANGQYIGYYNSSDGTEHEIKEVYTDNILIESYLDGEKQDLNLVPLRIMCWDMENALNTAVALSEKHPCVQIVAEAGFPNRESVLYNVFFSDEEPCWYN